MRDDPDTSHVRDSTVNANDGTKKGANEPVVTTSGKISDAQEFDGSNDYITMAEIASLRLYNTDYTVEAWLKCDDYGPVTNWDCMVLVKREYEVAGYVLSIRGAKDGTNAGKMFIQHNYSGVNVAGAANSVIGTAAFRHYAWRYDLSDTQMHFELDGADDGDINLAANDENTADAISTGAEGGNHQFDGKIDELRVSTIFRTGAWIKASYETGRDNLLDWGSEEEAEAPTGFPHSIGVIIG